MNRQLKEQGSAKWTGNRLITLHRRLFGGYLSFSFEWIFFYIGVTVLCLRVIISLRNRELLLWTIPLLYFVINYFFILLLLKLNWGRYYLPTVIASKAIIAAGIYQSIKFIYYYLRRKTVFLRIMTTNKKL